MEKNCGTKQLTLYPEDKPCQSTQMEKVLVRSQNNSHIYMKSRVPLLNDNI